MSINDSVRLDARYNGTELAEVAKRLSIGERMRVFCDDGVFLVEKISQTQFELIEWQGISNVVN